MLHLPAQLEPISERIGAGEFKHPLYREIFTALQALGADATMEELAARLSPEAVVELQALRSDPEEVGDVQRTIDGSLGKLHVLALELENAEIDRLLQVASDSEKDELIRRKSKNQESIRGANVGSRHFGKSSSFNRRERAP